MGDHVILKVMTKRRVVRFGRRGKLPLRYIRPFEILERVGTVAYRLALLPSLLGVHEVFHVTPQKYPRIFIIILLYILGMSGAKLGFSGKMMT